MTNWQVTTTVHGAWHFDVCPPDAEGKGVRRRSTTDYIMKAFLHRSVVGRDKDHDPC